MRLFYKRLLMLVAVISPMNSGVAQGETLQDAIGYMLRTNPNIKASSHNRLAKDQEVMQAKAGYYPTINFSSEVGVTNQSHPFYDTIWPRSAVLSLRQNVFRFFGTESEVRRLKSTANSQAYLLQGTSENVALLASKVYLDVLRNLELADLAKENLINHQRIADQMKLRSVSGVDRKADLDQVMGRLALAQSNAVIATANNIDAKTSYQAVIGRLPEDLAKPQPVGSLIPESMEELENLALQCYPILKSAQADLDARLAQYKTAKSQLYPTIDLAVDYAWQNDVKIAGYQEDLRAIASVNFNIFNGWFNRARVSQTAQQIKEAEEILNSTKRQIVQSVRLSWEAYKAAQEKVAYLEEYVKGTGLTATAFAAQWNIGRRTMFDLLDTQAEYITARASLVSAQYDMAYAEYRVLNSLGKLVNTLGLQWPEESRVDATFLSVPVSIETLPQKDAAPVAPPVNEVPKTEEAPPLATPVAPQVSEVPKTEEAPPLATPVAPQVNEVPKTGEAPPLATPVAPQVNEVPKTEEAPPLATPVAPQGNEVPKTGEAPPLAPPVAPQVNEVPKTEEAPPLAPPDTSSNDNSVKKSEAAAASTKASTNAKRPYKNIKGIVLMDGTVIEGQILRMNVYTVKILNKAGQEASYSFEKEVKGFIKEEE